jgi:hypothetical protein
MMYNTKLKPLALFGPWTYFHRNYLIENGQKDIFIRDLEVGLFQQMHYKM